MCIIINLSGFAQHFAIMEATDMETVVLVAAFELNCIVPDNGNTMNSKGNRV